MPGQKWAWSVHVLFGQMKTPINLLSKEIKTLQWVACSGTAFGSLGKKILHLYRYKVRHNTWSGTENDRKSTSLMETSRTKQLKGKSLI